MTAMRINVFSYLEDAALLYADKTALADDKSRVTFAEWLDAAERIGSAVATSCDDCIRKPVLVFVDRNIYGLIGFMGVLASGNFYVPIDSRMPDTRIKLIVDILNPVAAITFTVKDKTLLENIGYSGLILNYAEAITYGSDKHRLRANRGKLIDLDPVYSIFTSGSTGIPKGVIISHRGMIDLAEWLSDTLQVTSNDALGNQTPFYFDGSVKDIALCIKTGATIYVIGKKYFTFPKLLVNYLNENKITALLWATSAITLVGNSGILDVIVPKHVRLVTFAGEAMPAKQLNQWIEKLDNARFFNLYGPTEITVDCTYYEVTNRFPDDMFIPIGKACRNMEVLILNEDNHLVGVDEVGELCVRGTGVAMGYYGNGAKTAESFTQNPLNPYYNDLIYRTGDLVKYDADGNLLFISRKDFQIKHKGNRIELGEIEVAVNSIPSVSNAACVFDQPNDKIVLYYTTIDGQDVDVINLVKERIPIYMFPEVIVRLDVMPYNMNGKIDRIELKKRYEAGL